MSVFWLASFLNFGQKFISGGCNKNILFQTWEYPQLTKVGVLAPYSIPLFCNQTSSKMACALIFKILCLTVETSLNLNLGQKK